MTKKKIIEITREMAHEVGVFLKETGTRFVAKCNLVSKGKKIGEEVAAVTACNDKQARLAIKKVMEVKFFPGIGVKITECWADGTKMNDEFIHNMNTHQKEERVKEETKEAMTMTVEETKKEIVNEMKKIALVGDTVDYGTLGQALNGTEQKLVVGDAMNKEHLNALFRIKNGNFENTLICAYLAHKGEVPAYSVEKLGFTPVTLTILSNMSPELRAQLMKEALTNKASILISNAPALEPPKPETKKEEKPVTEATPATQVDLETMKARAIAKLVELGQALEEGADVVADINKVGSVAHQRLGMSEADIMACIQQGADKAKATAAAYEQAKESYDSVAQPSTTIEIPDEEPSQESLVIPEEDNHVNELAELVLVSLKGGEAATARVMADFVLRNTNDAEEATEIVTDILGLFSEIEDIVELANGLVIGGTLVRDGQYHKVIVTEDFQGSLFA